MDTHSMRPRYFGGHRKNSDVPTSASSHEPVAVVLREQEQIRALTSGHTAPAVVLDFAIGAKAYKKHRSRSGIFRGLKIAASISLVTMMVLGGFGFWLNHKYEGRALPFSYVGGISVGGLTQAQVKEVLDTKVKELNVTLVDGGLRRTVPASLFGATFDTKTASEQIIPDFNPFAFLDRRSVDVPVTVSENKVDGYMRVNIHPGQTKPADAQIAKDKTKLIVKPQVTGFRSDPAFVAENVRLGLSNLKSPVVNVNAVTLKPTIAEADLVDDVQRANRLLGTNITVAYGRALNIVTPAQKLAWVQFDTSGGTKDVQINFSRSLIRQYVVDLAKRYQTQVAVPKTSEPGATAAPVTPVQVIDNIEEVTDAIVAGLTNGQATASKFVASKSQNDQSASLNSTVASLTQN